jgi:hypothetical protein
MILILMWQTFLLRYGLLNILISEFFYSFLIVIIVIGIKRYNNDRIEFSIKTNKTCVYNK